MIFLENKGLSIDFEKLSELLSIPVIPTIAVRNKGLKELFEKAREMLEKGIKTKPVSYGKEVEEKIKILVSEIDKKYTLLTLHDLQQ